MGYQVPVNARISDSWQGHRNRPKPSTEPGTDYASAHGTPVAAAEAGRVVDVKHDAGGATGRFVTIDIDDGRRVRYLHMQSISVAVGQRVGRGQIIGKSGGSGFGSNTGYGAHVHVTLWARHAYSFGSNATLDFEKYVGGGSSGGTANIGAGQRTAGPNGVRRRKDASSKSAEAGEMLKPGVVGNFTGWKRGENVSGNDVWYQGTSGDWFWSGGFKEGANGTGLKDLNAAALAPTQRRVGPKGVNGRAAASASSALKQSLEPGVIGNFTGFVRGEVVEGNNVWFIGISGQYFWSGGFDGGANTAGLPDKTPAPPVTPPTGTNKRTVVNASSNRRSAPYTAAERVGEHAANATVSVDAWTNAQKVENTDVWYRVGGSWSWAGGFTSQSTDGIPRVDAPPAPSGPPPASGGSDNPRNLPKYTPVYPGAQHGLVAPLGDGARGQKGNPSVPTPVIIDRAILHRTGNDGDNLDWFSYKNSRESCPNWYVRKDGTTFEMIRPKMKPALTGSEWNWRSVGWEVLGSGEGTPQQFEVVADTLAWLASHDGKQLDGIPVSFKLDRTHFLNHRDVVVTECPGDWWAGQMDNILTRAKVLLASKYSGKPVEPGDETVAVSKSLWEQLRDLTDKLFTRK